MIHYKYLFLYISLSILFLNCPISSAHNKTVLRPSPAPSPSKPTAPTPSDTPTANPPTGSETPSVPSSSFSFNSTSTSSFSYAGSFSKVYAFGDSYTDTGNAYLLGGLKTFMGSFLSRLVNGSLGGSPLPGHRQSNGRLLLDFLCEDLSIPYLPPFKQTPLNFSTGVNFAVAGATAFHSQFVSAHNISNPLMWKGVPLNFQTQLDWFHKFTQDMACKGKSDSECKTQMGDSLFWIGDMGGNDYARLLGSQISSMKSLTETTVGQVTTVLNSIMEKGAKYIMVQGLPPIGCTPLHMMLSKSPDRDPMGCAPVINSVIQAHNELLKKKLEAIRKQCTQCTILYGDMWNAYKTILQNHKKFNFAEPFKACCGTGGGPYNCKLNMLCGSLGTTTCKDPSAHMFWDGIHFSEAMYKHLSKLIISQKGFTSPISFAEMVKAKKLAVKAMV